MKILIVEDDLDSRWVVNVHLSAAGYEVVEAEDGQIAWELLQREPFQMVITDWMMPRLDGKELIQRIRSRKQESYTYIIMLTAIDDKPLVVIGLESGADEYLTKPFDSKELLARVASGVRILKLEEQLREARQEMEVLALHDGLTNLFNRRAIEEQAEGELNFASRKGLPLSIILLDIDHFKSINDQYGHKIGDDTLRRLALVLVENIRLYDHVGRWGGEEFIVLLPDTRLEEAVKVAERLRVKTADAKFSLDNGEQFPVSISLGVACASGTYPLLLKLVDAADQALYQAKESGRNRVCSFDQPIE